jgi:lysophospholipase L1-like esterase
MSYSKIVCVGDSLTEGYGIDRKYWWTEIISAHLKIDIINSGISGDTTGGMLSRFIPMVVDHQPSHTIIMGGTNDLWFGLSDNMIISNILAMTKIARHHNIETIIGIPTPYFPGRENMKDDMFLSSTHYVERIINYQNLLKRVAIQKELPVIDFSENMTSVLFLEDGIHPNEKGHHQMAETAIRKLQLLLK